jgi:hypothetical protein
MLGDFHVDLNCGNGCSRFSDVTYTYLENKVPARFVSATP